MLSQAKLQSIIWTSNRSEAEVFYRDVLGLELKDKSAGAFFFDSRPQWILSEFCLLYGGGVVCAWVAELRGAIFLHSELSDIVN